MDLRRLAGAAGLVSAALFILTIILTFSAGAPPALDDPAQKVTAYYQDNRSMLQLNGVIGFLSLFTLALWFIPLYRWLRDRVWAAEPAGVPTGEGARSATADDTGTWITVALAGFIATGAVAAVQNAVATALAQGIEDELGGDEALVTVLFDIFNGLAAAIGALFALFLIGLALSARGTSFLPQWARPVALVAAALSLVSVLAPFTESDFIGFLGLIAFALFIVVLIGSSLVLFGTMNRGVGGTRTP